MKRAFSSKELGIGLAILVASGLFAACGDSQAPVENKLQEFSCNEVLDTDAALLKQMEELNQKRIELVVDLRDYTRPAVKEWDRPELSKKAQLEALTARISALQSEWENFRSAGNLSLNRAALTPGKNLNDCRDNLKLAIPTNEELAEARKAFTSGVDVERDILEDYRRKILGLGIPFGYYFWIRGLEKVFPLLYQPRDHR